MNLVDQVVKSCEARRVHNRYDRAPTKLIFQWTFKQLLFISYIYIWKRYDALKEWQSLSAGPKQSCSYKKQDRITNNKLT